LVEAEELSTGHARALLGVDDVDIQRRVARNIVEQSLSVRETERAIKRIIAGVSPADATLRDAKAEIKADDANVRAAETKLRRRFGTQVRILPSQKGEGGKIELEYYNAGDLDRLYQLLTNAQESSTSA
jgi:ParB family chromosome partitioning protein